MGAPQKIIWPVLVGVGFLALVGAWIFTQNWMIRLVLAGSLALAILIILGKCGIFSTPEVDPGSIDPAWQALAIAVLVLAMLFTLFCMDVAGIVLVWVLVMILFVIFLATIGVFIMGRPMGLFISSRNRMSLATLQTILWTVVLLSAFFTVAAALIQAGEGAGAFNIALDQKLWVLMGISVTTLAGTPLILDGKSRRRVSTNALREYVTLNVTRIRKRVIAQKGRFPRIRTDTDDEFLEELMDTTKTPDNRLRSVVSAELDGSLYKAENPRDATVLDLFRGDEGADWDRADLGKVQMFFFTVIGALAYMLVLAGWIATLTPAAIPGLVEAAAAGAAAVQFPPLSEGFIAVLGISHAGFLGNSAANRMPGQ